MDKIFAAFDKGRDFQNFKNVLILLKRNNKTIDEAIDYIEKFIKEEAKINRINEKKQKIQIRQQRKISKLSKLCPHCHLPMEIFPGHLDGTEGILGCRKCRYSEYDGRPVQEMRKELLNGSS